MGVLIVALILGVPVAPALAALVFIGAFVPLVGAFVSGFVAVLVALVALGWVKALIMLAGIIVVMQVEGHILQPFLLGRAVKLHPLAVLLAIAIGIIVGGIVGALDGRAAAGLHQVVHPVPGGRGRTADRPGPLAVRSPPELDRQRRRSMSLRFAGLELDLALFELRRDGARVPLEPQAFDVLVYLIDHRDRIVSKEELMDQIWGGRFVSEAAVTSRIKQARRAVGDDGQAQRVIKTLHGRGYHFVAPVTEGAAGRPPDEDRPAPPAAPTSSTKPLAAVASGPADRTAPAPLVGRDSEVGLLRRLFDQTRAGRGHTVLLAGEPGIGKSALLTDLIRYAEAGGGWC